MILYAKKGLTLFEMVQFHAVTQQSSQQDKKMPLTPDQRLRRKIARGKAKQEKSTTTTNAPPLVSTATVTAFTQQVTTTLQVATVHRGGQDPITVHWSVVLTVVLVLLVGIACMCYCCCCHMRDLQWPNWLVGRRVGFTEGVPEHSNIALGDIEECMEGVNSITNSNFATTGSYEEELVAAVEGMVLTPPPRLNSTPPSPPVDVVMDALMNFTIASSSSLITIQEDPMEGASSSSSGSPRMSPAFTRLRKTKRRCAPRSRGTSLEYQEDPTWAMKRSKSEESCIE